MDITEEFGCDLTSTWLSLRQPIGRCVPMGWRRDKEIKQHRDWTSGAFTPTTRAPDTSTAVRSSYVPHDIFTPFFAREQKQGLPTLCPSQIKCDPEEPCLGWGRKQRLCVEKITCLPICALCAPARAGCVLSNYRACAAATLLPRGKNGARKASDLDMCNEDENDGWAVHSARNTGSQRSWRWSRSAWLT